MRCAGILLTGGTSRRFGSDKALAVVRGETLAARGGRLLRQVSDVAVEVGPGLSGLPAVADLGEGPLGALAAGWANVAGCDAALLLACDLPLVDAGLLGWLVSHPADASVVPITGSPPQAQPLCARWSATALAAVAGMVESGERSMRALLAGPDVVLVGPADWSSAAGPVGQDALADADTTTELERLVRLLDDQS